MAIRRWHYGKLVMLWAWGVALMFVCYQVLRSMGDTQSGLGLAAGFVMIAAVIAIPVGLSVITWKWLTGKEAR
jgi:hypothetical protein